MPLCDVGSCCAETMKPPHGPWRLLLKEDTPNLAIAGLAQARMIKRRGTDQQLIEHHTERVNVGPNINIVADCCRLLRAHVFWRPYKQAELRKESLFGQPLVCGLSHAE